jgi:hypothetical protein
MRQGVRTEAVLGEASAAAGLPAASNGSPNAPVTRAERLARRLREFVHDLPDEDRAQVLDWVETEALRHGDLLMVRLVRAERGRRS